MLIGYFLPSPWWTLDVMALISIGSVQPFPSPLPVKNISSHPPDCRLWGQSADLFGDERPAEGALSPDDSAAAVWPEGRSE